MPVYEFYVPDFIQLQRHFCAWAFELWRRVTMDLRSSNEDHPRDLPHPAPCRLHVPWMWLLGMILLTVDWLGRIRSVATLIFCHFAYKTRRPLLTHFRTYSICWFNDIHFGMSMTPGRLARECVFARYQLLAATGISEVAQRMQLSLTVSSLHLTFQQPLRLFTPFVIDTRVVCYDSRSMFVAHRVSRLRDERTVAVVMAVQALTSDSVSLFDLFRRLGTPNCRRPSPAPPPETKAAAHFAAAMRERLAEEVASCRTGRRHWSKKDEEQMPQRHLCLQERLKTKAQR